MRKYWAFFRGNIYNTLTFRGPLFVWLISGMLSLVATVYLWLSTTQSGPTIGGYSKDQLITYYILVMALSWIVNWQPFYWLKDEIADGSIVTTTLIKPVSQYLRVFFAEAGWRVVAIWWGLFGTVIFIFWFHSRFFFPVLGINIIFLILSVILATLVVFSLSMVMALFAFWFTHVDVFDAFNWAARLLFGGQGIPISFLPEQLRILANILPFRYMISFPLEIYFQKLNNQEIILGLFIETVWLVFLYFLHEFLLGRALKSYTSFGS